jgi:glutaredoxin
MKQIIVLATLMLLITLPLATAASIDQTTIQTKQTSPATLDFTHDVIAEYVTTTTCPYCPTASSQLWSIYQTGDYPFHFVTLVANQNNKIFGRIQELDVSGVPVVFFDGKYASITGAQPDETNYRTEIETAGSRTTPDIDINLDVKWQGPAILKITVTVTNNEPEEYNGHVRVYILEKESRWSDATSQPFHNALLYIPLDKPLAIPYSNPMMRSDTYTFTRLWIGSIFGFGDLTEENTLVLAALFDQKTDKAVECTSATPLIDSSTYPLLTQRPLLYLLSLLWEKAYLYI